MFEIKYRLDTKANNVESITTKEFDEKGENFYAFIQLTFNGHSEGQYNNDPKLDGILGNEVADYWFLSLLKTIENLSQSGYHAFAVLEVPNKWLEFKHISGNVIINLVNAVEKNHNNFYPIETVDPLYLSVNFKTAYEEPKNYNINFNYFKTKILENVGTFIDDIKILNPELLKTKTMKNILEKFTNANKG